MPKTELVQCPDCGWTGSQTDLDDTHGGPACPACGASVKLG